MTTAKAPARSPYRVGSPKATPMELPGYVGNDAPRKLLSWKWAERLLKRGQTYWLSTTRPDSRPHLMPVWALWHSGVLYFSTGPRSRKALNLEAKGYCVVGTERGLEAVVMEGLASRVPTDHVDGKVLKLYQRKYHWEITALGNVIYAVRPSIVFGLNDKPNHTTRWHFPA